MIKHSFFLTDKQQEDLLEQAKSVGANDIPEFLDKAIQLTKIYATALKEGYEFIVVDSDAQILENNTENKTAIIGPKKSIVFVTEKLMQALQIEQKIRESNNFGFPVDGFEA